jgi:hypothetical protein
MDVRRPAGARDVLVGRPSIMHIVDVERPARSRRRRQWAQGATAGPWTATVRPRPLALHRVAFCGHDDPSASWSTVTTTATGRGRGAGRKAIQRGRARAQPARARGRRGSLCRLARRSVSRRWLSPHGFRCGGQQNRLGQALRCRLGVAMFICALLSRRSSLLLLTKSQFNFPSISNQRWRHNKINLGGDSSSQNKYAPKFKLDAVI